MQTSQTVRRAPSADPVPRTALAGALTCGRCCACASLPRCEDAAGTSVDVDGCLRLTTSVLARAVTVEMPAEDAPGDFDDGNDANYKLMLDEEEDSQPGPDDGEPDVDG
jgi:hypothetical protein